MTVKKISEFAALAGSAVAAGDLFTLVDVSDTSSAASGTNKSITRTELIVALLTLTIAEYNALLSDADFATGGGTVSGASSGTNTGDNAANSSITPSSLGLVIGTDVQPYDADLDAWAGVTPGAGIVTALAVAVGTDGAPVVQGGALGTPSGGNLASCTADGTNAVGFKTVPQNSQSAAYTTVLADSGMHLLHPSADTTARTFTIDSNANVAYPIGTAITFVNQNGAGVLTIAITTDVMRLAGAGTTGSRSLAANGIATALKLTATEWIISGTGLT